MKILEIMQKTQPGRKTITTLFNMRNDIKLNRIFSGSRLSLITEYQIKIINSECKCVFDFSIKKFIYSDSGRGRKPNRVLRDTARKVQL